MLHCDIYDLTLILLCRVTSYKLTLYIMRPSVMTIFWVHDESLNDRIPDNILEGSNCYATGLLKVPE